MVGATGFEPATTCTPSRLSREVNGHSGSQRSRTVAAERPDQGVRRHRHVAAVACDRIGSPAFCYPVATRPLQERAGFGGDDCGRGRWNGPLPDGSRCGCPPRRVQGHHLRPREPGRPAARARQQRHPRRTRRSCGVHGKPARRTSVDLGSSGSLMSLERFVCTKVIFITNSCQSCRHRFGDLPGRCSVFPAYSRTASRSRSC